MNITGDYHTHSTYSKNHHGKHSVKEMAYYAKELGLESYGIADHGPKHVFYGIKRKNIQKLREQVDELKRELNMNIYMGIEANLISKDGSIDLTEDEIQKLDILLVGYHKGCKNDFVNLFNNKEKQKQINTQAYINCINKYKVDILTHINEYIKVDVYSVATACKEKGTLIELNNKHVRFNEKEAKELIDSGCKFIINSDAHKKQNIARLDNVLEFIEKYQIPHDRIVNIDKLYR